MIYRTVQFTRFHAIVEYVNVQHVKMLFMSKCVVQMGNTIKAVVTYDNMHVFNVKCSLKCLVMIKPIMIDQTTRATNHQAIWTVATDRLQAMEMMKIAFVTGTVRQLPMLTVIQTVTFIKMSVSFIAMENARLRVI